MVIDELAKRHNVKLSTHKSRTDIAAYKLGVGVGAFSVILSKSKSYMNESGGPIKALANFYSVEPQQVIVLHDELDIPFAAIRSKIAGGDNGHNGLKSLTSAFFVLKQFSKEEKKDLGEFLDRGADVVESLITKGLDLTQSQYNS